MKCAVVVTISLTELSVLEPDTKAHIHEYYENKEMRRMSRWVQSLI